MADYIYKRKDGGETLCYGKVDPFANYALVCEDEGMDGIAADIGPDTATTWFGVCRHLEKNYCDNIEQVETV